MLPEIINHNGEQAVSARTLHKALDSTERFAQWFEKMLKYDFEEGVDYTGVKTFTAVNNGAPLELQDYAMTLDMAKEISLVQKTAKGKEFRKYFIGIEKKAIAALLAIKDQYNLAIASFEVRIARLENQQPPIPAKPINNVANEFVALHLDNWVEAGWISNKHFKFELEAHYLRTNTPRLARPTHLQIKSSIEELCNAKGVSFFNSIVKRTGLSVERGKIFIKINKQQ